jgi:hypothetical protein
MRLHRIKDAQATDRNRLRLLFEDGTTAVVDFEPIIREGGVYEPLGDESYFRRFRVERNGRVLAWPDDIEFCADALWQEASGGDLGTVP